MESNQQVNKPGYYGSVASASPVSDLADTVSSILDLIAVLSNPESNRAQRRVISPVAAAVLMDH
jgi:hypothetical protein